jgi:hypothetical protein
MIRPRRYNSTEKTVPLGGGFGRIVKWGKQPLNPSLQAFYNIEYPTPRIVQGPNLENQAETRQKHPSLGGQRPLVCVGLN